MHGRPEQWRSRGEQSWKNQKEQRETLPVILLLRQVFSISFLLTLTSHIRSDVPEAGVLLSQVFQVSSRVYLLTCIFEIIKLAIPLVVPPNTHTSHSTFGRYHLVWHLSRSPVCSLPDTLASQCVIRLHHRWLFQAPSGPR